MATTLRFATACAIAAVACDHPTEAIGSGALALGIVTAPGSAIVLDSGRVHVEGPTDTAVSATPGSLVRIEQLMPGIYTVSLEGFLGNAVDQFGRTADVEVAAGHNTPVDVSMASFRAEVTPFSPDTILGLELSVGFPSVPGATSYVVEASTDPGFGSPISSTVTASPAPVTVSEFRRYFVRVSAVDPFGGRGGPSDAQSVWTAFRGQATDPAGDATPSASIPSSPDLTSATLLVTSDSLSLRIEFAAGTFDLATSRAQVALDVDQSTASGDVRADYNDIGIDFLVNLGQSHGGVQVLQFSGVPNVYNPVDVTASFVSTSTSVGTTVPLSAFGGDDGRMNFKVVSTGFIGPGSTGILDYLTDIGVPPGTVE